LDFSEPLLISSGDFADEVTLYVYKDYFLRAWYPAKEKKELGGAYDVTDVDTTQENIKGKKKAKDDKEKRLLQANKIDPKFLKAPPINTKELNDESLYYKMKFTLPVQVLTLSKYKSNSNF
jgi:hypothetical protein